MDGPLAEKSLAAAELTPSLTPMIWWQREISLDPITLYGGLVWIKFSAAPLYCMVFSPRRQCFSLELICVRTQIKHSACFSLSSFSTVGFFGKTKKGKKK